MTQDEKLDEALKGTFPASDAFYLSPDKVRPVADDLPRDAKVNAAIASPAIAIR